MRDPFGRFSVRKRFVRHADCGFCGATSRQGRATVFGSWRYRTEHDGGRVDEDTKTFCSLECRRAYHT